MPTNIDLSQKVPGIPSVEACTTRVSEDGLRKFIALYEEQYDKPIAMADAREMASRILTLYALIPRPLPCHLKSMRRHRERVRRIGALWQKRK